MRIVYSIIIFAFLTSQFTFAEPAPSKPFNHWVKKQMQAYQIPGVSIVVIKDYKIEWIATYGTKDLATDKPITDTTLFQAGSISKPVTAVAVLKSVQDEKFTLDENINELLTTWRPPANPYTQETDITVRELLSHCAGFNVPGFIGYASDEKPP